MVCNYIKWDMCMRLIKRLLILALLLIAVPCWGATYNFYFSNTGTDTPDGSPSTSCNATDNACTTITHVNTVVDYADSGDTVYLYFNRGDTWSYDTRTLDGSPEYALGVVVTDPTVHFDAYGSGALPIFDGLEDHTSADNSVCGGSAPCQYTQFFRFEKENCSISNLEIVNTYGHAIRLGGATDDADGFTLDHVTAHNIGRNVITVTSGLGIENAIARYNTIYETSKLRESGDYAGWGGAIGFTASGYGSASMCKNNIVQYNLLYDNHGEAINAPNSVVEYNVIGDSYSVAINIAQHDFDALTSVVRYNFIIGSDGGAGGGRATGIRIYDEEYGGTNSAADISIYGNIIINRNYGIRFYCNDEAPAGYEPPNDTGDECDNPYGSIKIYNNLAIDNDNGLGTAANYYFDDLDEASAAYIYNNVSIHYDRTNIQHTRSVNAHANWTYSNNSFYPVDVDDTVGTGWTTAYVTGDPVLPGAATATWTDSSGAGYYNSIDYTTHLYPTTGDLIQGGYDHAFEQTFLTTGTDFEDVLDGASAFTEAEQHLTLQDIGPWARGTSEPVPFYPLQGVKLSGAKY